MKNKYIYKKLNNVEKDTEFEKRLTNLEQTILSLIKVVELQSTQIKYILKKIDSINLIKNK